MCLWLLLAAARPAYAQQEGDDSTRSGRWPRIPINDIFYDAMRSIHRNPNDTIDQGAILLARSEQRFRRYEGRIIRHITIDQLSFEERMTDTASWVATLGTRFYNSLHVNTRDWVIRDNLFIRAGQPLVAYKLADNERYLRTLDYIQDVRILVKPVRGSADSVDLVVVTKDLFTITGSGEANGLTRLMGGVADANFLGLGQRLEFATLLDQNRHPRLGFKALYRKYSIARSFIDATVSWSQMQPGSPFGRREEEAVGLRLDRPLISPFSTVAGGLELGHHRALNYYREPEATYFDYAYSLLDVWAGHNLGTHRLADDQNYNTHRNRRFVSLRYLQAIFDHKPWQVGNRFDPVYNDRQALLGRLTLFHQEYYKTQYIYGFGLTEDMPYGYKVALTGGWYRQNQLDRAYAGLEANRYVGTPSGAFYQLFLRSGGFLSGRQWQDVSLMAGISAFSPLMSMGRGSVRHHVRSSFTGLFNRLTYERLRIDNQNSLRHFGTDSVLGDQRLSMYAESVYFSPLRFLGFQMAPFVFANGLLLAPEGGAMLRGDLYGSIGGGIRTRNENLIFGTMELRAVYFPRTEYGVRSFKLLFQSGLRYRYRTTYVDPPEVVRLNIDD